MTDEQIALARRAVACRGWKWLPGMRYRLHPTHPWFRYDGEDCCDDDGKPITQAPPNLQSHNAISDLTDPATLGCLLALVREAWGQPLVSVRWSVHGWRVLNTEGRAWCWSIGKGSTEAEALIAALEAVP